MRNRPVNDPTRHLATAVDPAPLPGRPRTWREELADLGVRSEDIPAVEALLVTQSMQFASEVVRRLMLSLGNSPAGVALRRAILGPEGRTLAMDANIAGCDRRNLLRAEMRVRKRLARRLRKTGPQPSSVQKAQNESISLR